MMTRMAFAFPGAIEPAREKHVLPVIERDELFVGRLQLLLGGLELLIGALQLLIQRLQLFVG